MADSNIIAAIRDLATNLIANISLAASELHIGQVGGNTKVFAATAFTCDTSAYGSGDVITDTLELPLAMRVADGTGLLASLTLIDKDDQGVAMDIYVLTSNVSLGTKNAAPSISDANAEHILGIIPVATTDWKDLGGVRVAYLRIPIPVVGASGSRSIYLSAVNGTGTPTFTAAGLMVRAGILQD